MMLYTKSTQGQSIFSSSTQVFEKKLLLLSLNSCIAHTFIALIIDKAEHKLWFYVIFEYDYSFGMTIDN